MKEPFDKKLSQRIKSVFENHQESPSEKEWEKFAAAYFNKPAKKPVPIWIWWFSGIAASLVFGIWLLNPTSIDHSEEQLLSFADSLAKESKTFTFEELGSIEKLEEASSAVEKITQLNTGNSSVKNKTPETAQKEAMLMEVKGSNQVGQNNPQDISIIAENGSQSQANILTKDTNPLLEEKAFAYIQNLLSEESNVIPSSKKDPFRIGFLLAPQTVSNTNQTIGLSAGIMSEFSVSKKLKIDMGIAYAQQNINPNTNGGILNASVNDALEANFGSRSQYNTAGLLSTGNLLSFNEELRFGQLEIPINLKYKLLERNKADIYFVSGISNMFYLNQERISTLKFANLSTAASMGDGLQSFSQRTVPDATNRDVMIGQLVNVAVGFEQNLSNGTFLYIEPFYKISVGNQTFAEQQFSIGGINLRMNFQLKK
ncbi:outer membrane beta-barrel protein [Mongoliitalea daihaiensis]|uniref:outer membrane beta-barrel protein n=1 Tax=Mongoliitalea daihaiensis TaxID=2782006 RepID=UPI001F443C95|nr:outer membrane beta-barrel protein [Mongoliitalea daihaiensis]UJP65583.1 outer membrane beta-barrel protein [Mongoliitalea daihaiensis]